MSMFNDIVWDAKGNDALCVNKSKTIKEYADRFPRGHWSFLGPGSEKKWYGTYDCKPDGSWNRTAGEHAAEFRTMRSSDIPLCQCFGEENQEAKQDERHQYTSTEVRSGENDYS